VGVWGKKKANEPRGSSAQRVRAHACDCLRFYPQVLEQASKAIWDKCAACSEAPLDCSNDDCKIFYKREAVNEQLSEALARKVKIDF
jgi:hypothetical protein